MYYVPNNFNETSTEFFYSILRFVTLLPIRILMCGYCMFLDLENYFVLFEKYITAHKLKSITLSVSINTLTFKNICCHVL
jgi:hypothetical protein